MNTGIVSNGAQGVIKYHKMWSSTAVYGRVPQGVITDRVLFGVIALDDAISIVNWNRLAAWRQIHESKRSKN